jgi:hypothetical protein
MSLFVVIHVLKEQNFSVTRTDFSVATTNVSVTRTDFSVATTNVSVTRTDFSVATTNFSVTRTDFSVATTNFSVTRTRTRPAWQDKTSVWQEQDQRGKNKNRL